MNQGSTEMIRREMILFLYPNVQDIQIDTLVCLMVFGLPDISTYELEYILIVVDFLLVDVLVFYNRTLFVFEFQLHIQQNIFQIEMASNNMLLKQVLFDG